MADDGRSPATQGYTGELDTDVNLDRPHAIEITFLAIATLYSLTLPLKTHAHARRHACSSASSSGFVFRIARSPAEETAPGRAGRLIGSLPDGQRTHRRRHAPRVGRGDLPLGRAVRRVARAPASSRDRHVPARAVGRAAGVEAPELLVAALFAWRLNTSAGLGSLVSSKVNQWTLLVGSLPIVFAISSGAFTGLPIDSLQREELFLTAAQSVFGVAVLTNRRMSVREAWMLLGLFFAQFILGGVLPEDLRAVRAHRRRRGLPRARRHLHVPAAPGPATPRLRRPRAPVGSFPRRR